MCLGRTFSIFQARRRTFHEPKHTLIISLYATSARRRLMFNSTSTTAGRQLLSPGKLTTQNAKIAFRRGSTTSSVNGASHFVPLSTWEDNRGPPSHVTSLPTSLASAKATPEAQADTTQVDSDASISSSSDEEFKPAARRVPRVASLKPQRDIGTQPKQEQTPQDTHKAIDPAGLKLFRPRQKPQHGPTSLLASSAGLLSSDFQANVNAVAQQAREQHLKQKQAAAAAEVELERLKGQLQREKALQASVAKGSIRLADKGVRLAERLAQVEDDISRQSELVQMYAEQLGLHAAPAMHDHLCAPAFTNTLPQSVVHGEQQDHPVSSSQHAFQSSGHHQKQAQALGRAPQQTAHRAETRQGTQPVSASGSAPSSSQPGSRLGVKDQYARSSADRRFQRGADTHAAQGRLRAAAAASKPRQGTQSTIARKGRQEHATDSRPNKRQKQTTSRALQSQRHVWMDRLTAEAAQEAARTEAAAWAVEYQPSWTYQDENGASQGPFHLAELKVMLAEGRLQDSTMVHDEEAEISIRLATLIANSQRNHSVLEPLPHAPGTGAAADGAALPATEASQDGGHNLTRQEDQPLVKQELSASAPSRDSGSESMDIDNSDAESPGQAARPVDHMWSPQYSPTKLAELVPVKHSPPPNYHGQAGNSTVSQSHFQDGASDQSRSVDPQGPTKHVPYQPGQLPHAQVRQQNQMQGAPGAVGHSSSDLRCDPTRPASHSATQSHVLPPSNQVNGAPMQPPSPPPPPPPPSSPMHNPSHAPTQALDAARLAHHDMPTPDGQTFEPGHQWQANGSPHEQHMLSYHHRKAGYPTAGPLHAAPGQTSHQSEQQQQLLQQLPYSATKPHTHIQQHSTTQPSTHLQLSSLSQHDQAPLSERHHHPDEVPLMHPYTHIHSANGAPQAPDGQAYWQSHPELASTGYGSGSAPGRHAMPIPVAHTSRAFLHDQSPQSFAASSWPQELEGQHRQGLAGHIKPEPGTVPPPHSTVHTVGQAFRHAPPKQQVPPQAYAQAQAQAPAATALSPELAAALAAGVFWQSLPSSDQQPGKLHDHQPPQAQMLPAQPRGKDSAAALPPELSAALASGQLNFQLAGSHAVAHSQQAPSQPEQAAFQRNQVPYQPGQALFQSDTAPFQPERASHQPRAANAYHRQLATSQPGPAGASHLGQAAFEPERAAHQPEQAAFQSGRAAFQPEHPAAGRVGGEQLHSSTDPVGFVARQPYSQVPFSGMSASAQHGLHLEPRHTSHNAGFGAEQPLQMTMNSPALGTHHHAAASHHDFAVGSHALPASLLGLQQSAVYSQPPLHDAQHAQHRSRHPELSPQHAQHVDQQHEQYAPQQAQRIHQQAQHGPQQTQHLPSQDLHMIQPVDHVQRSHQMLHSRLVESTTGRGPMLPQHAQHEPREHGVQRHTVYAERDARHQLPACDYQAEQQWQARGSHDGVPAYDGQGQWSPVQQWEDPRFEEHDNQGYQPLTEEEAELEWQRQLAEQEESEEDDRYYDVQPMLHAPDGYEDPYPPLSPRAPRAGQTSREESQGVYQSHQLPRDPNPHPHAGANIQQQAGHPDWQYEQQAQVEQYGHEGQVPVGEGQRRRHQRGGRRHRRPHPGAAPIPTRYPPGSNAGPSGSLPTDDQPGSHVELYGPSRSNFRRNSFSSHSRRGGANPRGDAVYPRGSAADPRASGQHVRGRGGLYGDRSAGKSTQHRQQTRASPSLRVQPVSGSASARANPAAQPRGEHGGNRGHQGSNRQLREPEYQANVVPFPYAQQSGYPL